MSSLIKFFKFDTDNDQISLFFIIYFFLISLSYPLIIGFTSNHEFSDYLFIISCILIIELTYFLFFKKILEKPFINNQILLSIFTFFVFIIWNNKIINNYINLGIYFLFLSIFALILNYFYKRNNQQNAFILTFISTIFLSGILHDFDHVNTKYFYLYFCIFLLTILTFYIFNKVNLKINYLFSLIIFLILFKVFLVSSNKDLFHYAWHLGPINSLFYYDLYEEVVSQYGFLNLLTIYSLSKLLNLSTSLILVSFIIFFIIIFYLMFLKKLFEITNYPFVIITLFSSFVIFANLGYSNLNGAIFIPSSSVFRFLPSLLTIIFFSKLIFEEEKKYKSNFVFFYCFFIISILWSFESFVFTCFPLIIFFMFRFFFNLTNKKKFIFFLNNKRNHFLLILSISSLLIGVFFFKEKNLIFFYEYALLTNASLAVGIKNNSTTLIFIFLIVVSYIILRDSIKIKKLFLQNLLFFTLISSYSIYFINRSVDNNIFSLLPFFIYLILCMRTQSKSLSFFRKLIITVLIFLSINISIISIFKNNEEFQNSLFSKKYSIPEYSIDFYQPSEEINKTINKFNNTPVTLISKNYIHEPNLNLPYEGYGLPILPLEMFSLLNDKRKNNLYDTFFNNNEYHLILCITECKFSNNSKEKNIRNKIFIGDKYKYSKIIQIDGEKYNEYLYLISKKLK